MMKILRNTTPLCYLPDGKLVCYSRGKVLIIEDQKVIKTLAVFYNVRERILGHSCSLYRLFRMGARAALALDQQNVLLSIGNTIFELNLGSGVLSEGFYCGKGIRPLMFTEIKGVNGFDDGIYFGGYLGNREKHPVNIYKRIGVDQWKVVYTFPQGSINHIHSLVADPYRSCIWIYTGDFDESAAIWKATCNFKSVETFVCNDQRYRGCVAFVLPEGLLYATDAPFTQNSIYLLRPDKELIELKQIEGSCIYGCQWNGQYVFSTTVEPDGINPTKMQVLFGRKRGRGIKDNFVHMYRGNIQSGFIEIYKVKKDFLPYCSFQFGVFRFPYGNNQSNRLYFQPVATAINDLTLMLMDMNKL